MATVSGAFGGLLAAAISNMNGVGGKPGWVRILNILSLQNYFEPLSRLGMDIHSGRTGDSTRRIRIILDGC